MKNLIFLLFAAPFVFACGSQGSVNSEHEHIVVVKSIAPDTVIGGEQFLAKIFLADSEFSVDEAYCDCRLLYNDSIKSHIGDSTCRLPLHVKNDTTYIAFKTNDRPGRFCFYPVTIFASNSDREIKLSHVINCYVIE